MQAEHISDRAQTFWLRAWFVEVVHEAYFLAPSFKEQLFKSAVQL